MLGENTIFKQLSEGCDKECRFTSGVSSVTDLYYPPVYDKDGVNINPDSNTTSTQYHCGVCGKTWSVKTTRGENSIMLLKE